MSDEANRRAKLAPVRKAAERVGKPVVYRPLLSFAEGGPDPFDSVECWPTPRAWCFAGTSTAQPRDRRDAIAGVSLTLRLARRTGETMPPSLGVELLQALARDAIRRGTPIVSGLSCPLDAPLEAHDRPSALVGVLFTADEELHDHGAAASGPCVVAAVGVTEDELEAARDWSVEQFAEVLAEPIGGLVTDVERASCLTDPAFAARVEAGIDRDGSSHGEARVAELSWSRGPRGSLRITVSDDALPALARMARGRLSFGRPFRFASEATAVVVTPEGLETKDAREDERALVVRVSAREAAALRARPPRSIGSHDWPELAGLVLVVTPSQALPRASGAAS